MEYIFAMLVVGIFHAEQPHTPYCEVDPLRFECDERLSEGDPRPSFDVDLGDQDDPSDDTPFEREAGQ